jgi:hypothetical protein
MVVKPKAKRAARKAAPKIGRRGTVPYYSQTTDFSCGPSSLLMAMKTLDPKIDFSRTHELLLWRESTSIFMGGAHHGGCVATGLALAAHRRGFDVEVWVDHKGTLLGSLSKDKSRAKVMDLLQQADLAETKRQKIPFHVGMRSIDDLRRDIREGAVPVVLVNMQYIHKDPTAHWVVVTGIDDETVTVNDPWISKDMGHTRRTVTDYVVPRPEFPAMTEVGPRREHGLVLLRRR